jgi:hypothetical protein
LLVGLPLQRVNFVPPRVQWTHSIDFYATTMPKMDTFIHGAPISRINHDAKKIFSRSVLASSENFAFVNGGNFAQRLIEGETR